MDRMQECGSYYKPYMHNGEDKESLSCYCCLYPTFTRKHRVPAESLIPLTIWVLTALTTNLVLHFLLPSHLTLLSESVRHGHLQVNNSDNC